MNRQSLLSLSLGLTAFLFMSCGPVIGSPAATTITKVQIPLTKSEVPRISAQELKDRLERGEAILVVDARAASAFESRHIAGAVSVPAHKLNRAWMNYRATGI